MHKNIWINWLVEFGPIVLFFVSLSLFGDNHKGFISSTAIFTATTLLALICAYVRDKRIALFPIITGIFIILFGVLTVFCNEPTIFIIKDSIYNGFFAVLLFVGIIKGKGLLKPLFASLFDMSDEGWRILSFRWMMMFIVLTLSNEIVRTLYSQQVWVMYKFFATLITIIFGCYQIFLARKHRNASASPWGMRIVNVQGR